MDQGRKKSAVLFFCPIGKKKDIVEATWLLNRPLKGRAINFFLRQGHCPARVKNASGEFATENDQTGIITSDWR